MSSALPGRAMVALWRGMTRYRTPSFETCVLFRDGACAEAGRACPPDPPSKSDGKPDDGLTTGVYVWERTLTPKLDGVRWEGTWRRITASEALVLAQKGNPFKTTLDAIVNENLATGQKLLGG